MDKSKAGLFISSELTLLCSEYDFRESTYAALWNVVYEKYDEMEDPDVFAVLKAVDCVLARTPQPYGDSFADSVWEAAALTPDPYAPH